MQHYIAGIDTGGTCTDAVLISKETQDVIGTGWTGLKRMESAKDHIS